jgi:hypothetical protein
MRSATTLVGTAYTTWTTEIAILRSSRYTAARVEHTWLWTQYSVFCRFVLRYILRYFHYNEFTYLLWWFACSFFIIINIVTVMIIITCKYYEYGCIQYNAPRHNITLCTDGGECKVRKNNKIIKLSAIYVKEQNQHQWHAKYSPNYTHLMALYAHWPTETRAAATVSGVGLWRCRCLAQHTCTAAPVWGFFYLHLQPFPRYDTPCMMRTASYLGTYPHKSCIYCHRWVMTHWQQYPSRRWPTGTSSLVDWLVIAHIVLTRVRCVRRSLVKGWLRRTGVQNAGTASASNVTVLDSIAHSRHGRWNTIK